MRSERLLTVFAALTVILAALDPRPISDYLRWLNGPTLAGLTGLLVLTQGVRSSGFVQVLARRIVARVKSVRGLALALVVLSALLAMVLTNDVGLFLVVPLTLSLSELVRLPRERLIVLEALAVNVGAALSPIGNPQNLLLWQRSGISMAAFVARMAPTFAIMTALLLVTTVAVFSGAALEVPTQGTVPPPQHPRLGALSLVLLAGLVVALQLHRPYLGAGAVVAIFLVLWRRVLLAVDWPLLATFVFIFLGLGHVANLEMTARLIARFDWSNPSTVYAGGILLSQIMSNVPATVLLAPSTPRLDVLTIAVNVGSFGCVLGSLANLIALRLEGGRGTLRQFHAISIPFLFAVAFLVRWVVG